VNKKVKCTLVQVLRLCTGRTAHRKSRGIALPFLDHGTGRWWWVSVTPRRSLPLGKARYLLYRKLGGPQGRSVQVRKISPPPGFDPRTVQLAASRYTDWATRPTTWWIHNKIFLQIPQVHVQWRNILHKYTKYVVSVSGLLTYVGKTRKSTPPPPHPPFSKQSGSYMYHFFWYFKNKQTVGLKFSAEENEIIYQIRNNINLLRWLLWGRNSIVKYYYIHVRLQSVNLGSTFSFLILRKWHARSRRFISSPMSRTYLGLTQPPIQRVPAILLRVVKRPGRDAYFPPWSNSKFKNE